jgi:hypothetical protein
MRQRLASSEARIPPGQPPQINGWALHGSPWLRRALMVLTAASAILVASLLFGRVPGPSGSASHSPSPDFGVTSEIRNNDLSLVLSSPRSVWTTQDAIQITATLSFVGGNGTNGTIFFGSGSPFVFNIRQVSGDLAALQGGWDDACQRFFVPRDAPLTQSFYKSGEVQESGPFDEAFFSDPDLHLPAGRWEVEVFLPESVVPAVGDNCGAPPISTSIQIEVVPGGGASQEPATTNSPNPQSEPTPTPVPSLTPSPTREACMTALASGVLGADPEGRPLLILDGEPPVRIVWSHPEDYLIDSEPVLTITSNRGELLATEGDSVQLVGGFNAEDTVFFACGITPPNGLDP